MPRPYRIDPQDAHDRAIRAAKSRTGPDYHLRKLTALLPSLSAEQRRRLAELVLAALARPESGAA